MSKLRSEMEAGMANSRKRKTSLGTLATKAMRRGVEKAVEEHRRLHVPMVVWRDGKVVKISASRVRLRRA